MPELAAAVSAGTRRELITFRAGAQEFCVDIMSVREIRGWTPTTPLPHTPGYIQGVVNLRGAVLPVIDLGARFGLPPSKPSQRHVIIVTQIAHQVVGLLVEAVSDILTVNDDVVQPPPELASDRLRAFIRGLLAIDGRMVSLIALDAILPTHELEAA